MKTKELLELLEKVPKHYDIVFTRQNENMVIDSINIMPFLDYVTIQFKLVKIKIKKA